MSTKVVAADGAPDDSMGQYQTLSISGDGSLVTVGALWDDAGRGSAYSFVQSGDSWVQQQKLTAYDGVANDVFGYTVAMSRDGVYLAVGAAYSGNYCGSVYVYIRSGASWALQQKLLANDGCTIGDWFGRAMAISADGAYLAVSAPGDEVTYADQGSVYMFCRSGSTWVRQQKLAVAQGALSYFGWFVALSADGNYLGVTSSSSVEPILIFVRSGSTWVLQKQIAVSGGDTWHPLAFAADATTLAFTSGTTLFVFDRSGSTWTQAATFAMPAQPYSAEISADGSYIVVGLAPQAMALAFYRHQSVWVECAKIVSNIGTGTAFGASVAMSVDGAMVAIGAYAEYNDQGAVYLQSLCPPGHFLDDGACKTCEAGTYSASVGATSNSACIPCSEGTYSEAQAAISASTCVECEAGKFSSALGAGSSSTCSSCPQGQYQTSTGQSACDRCEPGKYSSEEGATSPTDCKSCPAGTYNSESGAAICSSCPSGRFSSDTGATSFETCDVCPAGKASAKSGATSSDDCLQCTIGKYSGEGQGSCTSCPVGKYGTKNGATSASECDACPAGRYGDVEGATSAMVCKTCPTNTFTSIAGQAVCTDCPYGTCTKGQNGQSTCESCANFLVIAEVTGCSSCTTNMSNSICDGANGIFDCPTEGGVQIDIVVAGEQLANSYAGNLSATVDANPCSIISFVAAEGRISCVLPPGVGSMLQISVTELLTGLMGSTNWLSYAAPTIYSVHGCADSEPLPNAQGTSACSRNGAEAIVITGANFGPLQADVLVGGKQATLVPLLQAGWEQNTTMVQIPPGSGLFVGVNILQVNGMLSDSVPMLSFKRCEPGTFNNPTDSGTFDCVPCPEGTYSSQYEAYSCTPCTPGFYCNTTDEIACPFEYATSPPESSSVGDCSCRNNLMLVNGVCVCPPGTTFDTAGVDCEECAIGTFKSGWDLELCEACPAMMTTNDTGASSVDLCICDVEIGADALNKSCACAAGSGYSHEFGCQACSTNYYAPVPSVEQCASCKDIHSVAVSVNEFGSTHCQCPVGFFMDNIESETQFSCEACRTGMQCTDDGQTLESLQLRTGYWRSSTTSYRIRKCILAAACPQHSSGSQCEDGQEGALCSSCADGYAAYSSYSLCAPCEQQLVAGSTVLGVVLLLVVGLLIAYSKVDGFAEAAHSVWRTVSESRTARVHIKVLFVYLQLTAGFGRLLEADYPPSVNNFFAWLSFVNFSPSGFLRCVFGESFNFFGKLMFLTLLPIGIAVIVVLHIVLASAWEHYQSLPRTPNRWRVLPERILLLCFLFFSPVSTVVLEALNCDSDFDDGESYLRADYNISCTTSTYMAYRTYAIVMLFVYPIGIPFFCFVLLFVHRDAICAKPGQLSGAITPKKGDVNNGDDIVSKCAEDVAAIQACRSAVAVSMNQAAVESLFVHSRRVWQLMRALGNEHLSGITPLFEAYRPELWFFEIVEMSRRLLLSGLLVFMYSGTDKQLILAVLLCVFFIALYTFLNPFLSRDHNVILRAVQWGLFCQIFGTLILQQETFTNYRSLIGALIVVSGVFVPVVGLFAERSTRTGLISLLKATATRPKDVALQAWRRFEMEGRRAQSTEML